MKSKILVSTRFNKQVYIFKPDDLQNCAVLLVKNYVAVSLAISGKALRQITSYVLMNARIWLLLYYTRSRVTVRKTLCTVGWACNDLSLV